MQRLKNTYKELFSQAFFLSWINETNEISRNNYRSSQQMKSIKKEREALLNNISFILSKNKALTQTKLSPLRDCWKNKMSVKVTLKLSRNQLKNTFFHWTWILKSFSFLFFFYFSVFIYLFIYLFIYSFMYLFLMQH